MSQLTGFANGFSQHLWRLLSSLEQSDESFSDVLSTDTVLMYGHSNG